jgi:hypothetical protein
MSEPDQVPEALWVDEQAGPVVRPYAMTRGRTRHNRGEFDVISLVTAVRTETSLDIGIGPEHAHILRLSENPLSVAELAAYLKLPLGTIRVMLGDLLERGLVHIEAPGAPDGYTDTSIIEAAINGIRAL